MKRSTSSRLAWSIGTTSIALIIGGLVLSFVDRHANVPASSSVAWNVSDVLTLIVNIGVPAIGIVLASRRPENRLGWVFITAGASLGVQAFTNAYAVRALLVDRSLPTALPAAWVSNVVWPIAISMLCYLFLLFPTGRLPSRRWRPVAWFVAASSVLLVVLSVAFATMGYRDPFNANTSTGSWAFFLYIPFLGALVCSVAAVVVRYRGSAGDERLQLKWFVTGAVLVVAAFLANTPFSQTPTVLSVAQSLAFLLMWVAIAVAVLKYRLYEIDVVISRAARYATLAVFITVVYVGLVVGIGTAVGNRRSPLLSAIAAAVIAVAFQPVRQRAARFANRLVYGRRATPYEVLSDFAERMAGAYSIEDVLPRTARLLVEGTGAVRADVWLRVGDELRALGSWPSTGEMQAVPVVRDQVEIPGATRVVPVRHQGELLGALSIRKASSDSVAAAEEKLLADVASQAGLVLRNVRLIEELRASRQRLVAAQDGERRRLERNIHDGAQQQLVALAVKLNLAEKLAGRDPDRERELLAQLKAEATDALEDLRDLARGIYPPLLADRGLVAALEAQARKSSVEVAIEPNGIGRYPQEQEAAVYFCTLEALQNVAKYAGVPRASVRLRQDDGHLVFEVTDDGVGFDPDANGYGTGIQGMADRLAALGGALVVRSAPRSGTTVGGWVPVRSAEPVSDPRRGAPRPAWQPGTPEPVRA